MLSKDHRISGECEETSHLPITYTNDVIILPNESAMLVKVSRSAQFDLQDIAYKLTKYRGETYILMPWTLLTCRRSAEIGLVIKGMIQFNYSWSGDFIPREHQLITADFLVQNIRSFCFNGIGTGKTLTALWAADYLMTEGVIRKVLIVCTVSTMERVWESTIFRHFRHRTANILHGRKSDRLIEYIKFADFYILNHDGLKVMSEMMDEREDIDLVIVDEGAKFRNKRTDLWAALNAFACKGTGRGIWWLTGSPTPNSPTDAWAQAKIVNPSTVSRYYTRFREETMFRVSPFKWIPRKGWQDMIYSALKPSIRFDRDDCLDLPELQTIDHRVVMSREQAQHYVKMKNTFALEIKGTKTVVTAANEMVKLNKLIQVSSGAIYDSEKHVHLFDSSPKFSELSDILEEVGDKLILYIPFKHTEFLITKWLESQGTSWSKSYGVITGSVSRTKRDKIFHEFQHGDLKMIVAQPAAMAHGLTLTASNTIVWWSPVDSFEIYEQANGRITRDGQTRKQYVKRLICSDIEEQVYKRLENKESMQGVLLAMISKKPTQI